MMGGHGPCRARALRLAYIIAHGTATLAGDVAEVRAVKVALGAHARKVAISSNKSMIGHCWARPGRSRRSPPCSRGQQSRPAHHQPHRTRYPECDLDFIPLEARFMKVDAAASNSFGFRRAQRDLVFRRFDG